MTRVLHILRRLEPGGIENWLLGLLEAWPASIRPEFHLALEESSFGSLAPRFLALGAKLHHCPPPRHSWQFANSFRRLLKTRGPFAAVHCHTHYASPFALSLAAQAGVSCRIAHSHADFRLACQSHWRRAYANFSRRALRFAATVKLAVSQAAGMDLFGSQQPFQFLPCGFSFQRFLDLEQHSDPNFFTLVQVGRMVPEKNHLHTLRVLKALLRAGLPARLLLVGDGPLRPSLESACSYHGLTRQVEFLGALPNPLSALARADLALFPSHYEGLGLAALEAQAAGLPVLCAAHLPPELDLLPGRLHRLALDLPIQEWARKAMQLRFTPALPKQERHGRLTASPYSFPSNIQRLEKIYAG